MPLYAYKCPSCGHKFEALRSISAREEVVCEHCGKKVLREDTGKCAFGAKASGGCGGNCGHCPGCGH